MSAIHSECCNDARSPLERIEYRAGFLCCKVFLLMPQAVLRLGARR